MPGNWPAVCGGRLRALAHGADQHPKDREEGGDLRVCSCRIESQDTQTKNGGKQLQT